MSVSIGPVKVRLSIGALFCFALCIVLGEGVSLFLSVLALSLHEAAHWIAAKNTGRAPNALSIYPFGAVMRLSDAPNRDGEWVIALAGPLGSLVAAAATYALLSALPDAEAFLQPFARLNLVIGTVNLLPAFPLDGGRVAKAILLRMLNERAARAVAIVFTVLIGAAVFAAGVYLLVRGVPAWTLIVLPPHLILALFREWEQPSGTVGAVLERRAAMRSGAAEQAVIVVLSANATVGDAIAALSRRRYTILRVTDGARMTELCEDALLSAAARFGYGAALKDVIDRGTKMW